MKFETGKPVDVEWLEATNDSIQSTSMPIAINDHHNDDDKEELEAIRRHD